jgi:hypothetical protein
MTLDIKDPKFLIVPKDDPPLPLTTTTSKDSLTLGLSTLSLGTTGSAPVQTQTILSVGAQPHTQLAQVPVVFPVDENGRYIIQSTQNRRKAVPALVQLSNPLVSPLIAPYPCAPSLASSSPATMRPLHPIPVPSLALPPLTSVRVPSASESTPAPPIAISLPKTQVLGKEEEEILEIVKKIEEKEVENIKKAASAPIHTPILVEIEGKNGQPSTFSYFFSCPKCEKGIQVLQSELNCKQFRCGEGLNPHASLQACQEAVKNGVTNGCGVAFVFDGTQAVISEYK